LQEVAEVGGGGGNARVGYGGVAEIELPVEDLREALVQGDRRELTAEAPVVLAFDPAQSFDEVEIVLRLVLVGLRSRPELEAGADESKFVNAVVRLLVGRSMPPAPR